jgi:hypothetical protein
MSATRLRHAGESADQSSAEQLDFDATSLLRRLPCTHAQVDLHPHCIRAIRPQQGQAELILGGLLGNDVEARLQELQEFREERRIANAKSHKPP